jgi:uncharacterized protein (TIGR00255 family)
MMESMTGYGAAQHIAEGSSYSLEIRSLNNRYLKLSIKLPERLQFLETDVDRLLRQRLSRGSVTYTLRVRSDAGGALEPINVAALQQYVDQLAGVRLPSQVRATVDLATLAAMPGVCDAAPLDEEEQQRQRAVVTELTEQAIAALKVMRVDEGRALRTDLARCCESIRGLLGGIAVRAPQVVEEYHERLRSRVAVLMKESGLELAAEGLAREVAIFAERCSIDEEIARLNSHLEQFDQLCDRGEQVGRTLDFLTQEMLREANTIASKSSDTAIARHVVEIKGLIDRLKEQVQNVE